LLLQTVVAKAASERPFSTFLGFRPALPQMPDLIAALGQKQTDRTPKRLVATAVRDKRRCLGLDFRRFTAIEQFLAPLFLSRPLSCFYFDHLNLVYFMRVVA
jgi:hypothetical protein